MHYDNYILLCHPHHKRIDTYQSEFTADVLYEIKRRHEIDYAGTIYQAPHSVVREARLELRRASWPIVPSHRHRAAPHNVPTTMARADLDEFTRLVTSMGLSNRLRGSTREVVSLIREMLSGARGQHDDNRYVFSYLCAEMKEDFDAFQPLFSPASFPKSLNLSEKDRERIASNCARCREVLLAHHLADEEPDLGRELKHHHMMALLHNLDSLNQELANLQFRILDSLRRFADYCRLAAKESKTETARWLARWGVRIDEEGGAP